MVCVLSEDKKNIGLSITELVKNYLARLDKSLDII